MAKKSRTSNKKSNDKQKKLLALVLIILFIGLGVFLVVSSFAAKGGKGKPGSGTTVYVDSPYGIKEEPNTVKYGSSVILYVTDKITGQPLTSLPATTTAELAFAGSCSSGGSNVGTFGRAISNVAETVPLTAPSFANGATCTVDLQIFKDFSYKNTATTSFTITP